MKLNHILLMTLLISPLIHAAGIGVHIPFTAAHTSKISVSNNSDTETTYDPSVGIGFSFDTSIQKESAIGYRISVEYQQEKGNPDRANICENDCNYARLNFVNTFTITLLNTQSLKLWTGPRINVASNTRDDEDGYKERSDEIGIAPAIGINYAISKRLSLGLDMDYRWANLSGDLTTNDESFSRDFSGNTTGFTTRFLLFFRFNEPSKNRIQNPI